MYFEFSLWNGFINSKRTVWAENYDSAVTMYASNLPPAYIWSLVPIEDKK